MSNPDDLKRTTKADLVRAIECIVSCAQAYHRQGPAVVAANMEHIAREALSGEYAGVAATRRAAR